MTKEQILELRKLLNDDILERYSSVDYWDDAIIDDFVVDNDIESYRAYEKTLD